MKLPMNMLKPIKASSMKGYPTAVPKERKDMVLFLHDFIQKATPNSNPTRHITLLGFGSLPYKNYKKENISWPVVALANQKTMLAYMSAQ
jgi:hypothetical protein